MASDGPAYVVQEAADLEGARLSAAGQERVVEALEGHEAVVWLEQWLRSEKDLATLGGARGLYGCTVEAETDAAWCVAQPDGAEQQADGEGEGEGEGEGGVWVPKSSAELYQRHEDGLSDGGESPQQFLDDFTGQ